MRLDKLYNVLLEPSSERRCRCGVRSAETGTCSVPVSFAHSVDSSLSILARGNSSLHVGSTIETRLSTLAHGNSSLHVGSTIETRLSTLAHGNSSLRVGSKQEPRTNTMYATTN